MLGLDGAVNHEDFEALRQGIHPTNDIFLRQEAEIAAQEGKAETVKSTHLSPRRYAWAELLKRAFAVDALKCGKCGNTMKILCAVNPPDAVRKILDCLGLPSRPPPITPALIRCE